MKKLSLLLCCAILSPAWSVEGPADHPDPAIPVSAPASEEGGEPPSPGDDIAAEIEADETFAVESGVGKTAPGPVESSLGEAGAAIDSVVDDIVPALEQTGHYLKEGAETAKQKGGELVEEAAERSDQVVQDLKPALEQGENLVKEGAEAAGHLGTQVIDSLSGESASKPTAPAGQ